MSVDHASLEDLLARLNTAVAQRRGCEPGNDSLKAAITLRQEGSAVASAAEPAPLDASQGPKPGDFWPLAPTDWASMKLAETAAEELAMKCLMRRGTATGREIAEQIAVPFGLLNTLLAQLKNEHLVVHRGAAHLGDYIYQLSASGLEMAGRYIVQCAYDGAAPVALDDYIESVQRQSVYKQTPTFQEIAHVFSDLVLGEDILDQIGQAICAGHGFFLYGDSGNGKTSVAERVSRAFGSTIWIPRTLAIGGIIVRLFDPCNHIEAPLAKADGVYEQLKIDQRWVRIRRPTILAGGELTMERLEIRATSIAGVNEAPLQLKSNCGTLVIDDFGRQRIKPDELLNRWIVPLDRRIDFLNLPNGQTIEVPFDQLLIFSTNLRPLDLADEAFLRRIPYKIRAVDPTPAEFKELFRREGLRLGIPYHDQAIDDLIETHYVSAGRPLRCCHARDLLAQVKHYCEFKQLPLEMSAERFATAVRNYFAVMS